MKRLICALLAALLLCCPVLAEEGVLSESQLAEMEAISASDPLAVDFAALKAGLSGMADQLSAEGARQADPAKTASFDAMADRAQLLCYAAAEALRERHDASYDIQGYLDLTAQYVARCFWQLARLDEAAQNTSAYKEHLAQAGQLYYDCAVQCGVDDGSSFAVPQEDFDLLLAYCAYSGETGGIGRSLVNELLSYEAIHGQHSFTDFYLANEEEIDRLLADTGASLADYPDRGIYSIDGSPWEIGEVVFDGKTPYVAFADFLNRLGGIDLTDYAANADGRSLHWQLYGDDIRADETRVLLNGEAVELADAPFWSGGRLYLTLADASYLACAEMPSLEPFRYYPSLFSEEMVSGEAYLIRPYLGEDPPSEEELTRLEGIGAPINLQNLIWYGGLNVSQAASLAQERLNGVSGLARGAENSALARELLSGSWGIYSADDLRDSYDWLLEEGHRFRFREVVSSGGAPDWFLRKWGDTMDNSSFLAWDLARAVQICQWGCCAGYLSPYEATQLALDAAQRLRGAFDSWEAFADDYQMGYDAFLAEDADTASPYNALRREIIEQIYQDGSYQGVGWEPLSSGLTGALGALPALVVAAGGFLLVTLAAGGITLAVVLHHNRKRRRAAISVDPWELP